MLGVAARMDLRERSVGGGAALFGPGQNTALTVALEPGHAKVAVPIPSDQAP